MSIRPAEAGRPLGSRVRPHDRRLPTGFSPRPSPRSSAWSTTYIFFKEYINRLSWEPNPDNPRTILRYKIYRKTPSTGLEFDLLAEVDASVVRLRRPGVEKGAVHIYRITAVDDSGRESPPVIVRAPA